MNRGLYISTTSLIANQQRLEVLANNLANVNTNGYKKDIPLLESFPEKLLSKINDSVMNFRPVRENEFTYENEGQTHRARTSNGYFVINTPNGLSYVKEIRFSVDENGYLKTFYRDIREDLNTDNENYISDSRGNPLRYQGGDIEALLQDSIYYPPSNVIGTMNAGVNLQKMVIDFTQGELTETGGTLDLALNKSGFFKVVGNDGNTYYTRDGSFMIGDDGILITSTGEQVLSTGGAPIRIDGNNISIYKNGTVMVDDTEVGRLDIVDLENSEFLRKVGNNLFEMADGIEPEEIPYEGEVLQGYLEGSNVNSIDEMVEMITLLREFEAGQKVIRAQDEMLEKASNEIGRV